MAPDSREQVRLQCPVEGATLSSLREEIKPLFVTEM